MTTAAAMRVDLLIVGAGPAGLSAAEVALAHGRTVALVDQQPAAGGQLWRQGADAAWPTSRRARFDPVLKHAQLRYLPGHRLAMWLSPTLALLQGAEGAITVSADRVLLAAGAREFIPPFPGWTLPGVTGAGALQAMAKTGVDLAGERVSLVGSGPLLLASAATLNQSGARLTGIFEAQPRAQLRALALSLLRYPTRLVEAALLRRRCAHTRYECGWRLLAAVGDERVEAALLLDPRGKTQRVACSRLGVSYALVPNIECAAGLNLSLREDGLFACLRVDAEQRSSNPKIYAAGEITGIGGGALAELEGQIAALSMVGAATQLAQHQNRHRRAKRFADLLADTFGIQTESLPKPVPQTLLCRCEDVSWSAVVDAESSDWRSLKLGSRIGMGACQGRTCGAVLRAYGYPSPVNSRPPIMPVSAATLASLDHVSISKPQGSTQ